MPVTINRFHLFVSGVLEILLAFFDKLYTLINRILVFFDVMYCCAIPVLTQRLFTATSRTIVVCLRTTSAFQVFVLNAFLECAFSAAHQTRLNPENTLVLVGHYKPLFLTESLSWSLSVAGAGGGYYQLLPFVPSVASLAPKTASREAIQDTFSHWLRYQKTI